MHPIMPFFSEELWQQLPETEGSIMNATFPKVDDFEEDAEAAEEMVFLKDVVVSIRRIRADYQVVPKQEINALIRTDKKHLEWLNKHAQALTTLAKTNFEALDGEAPEKVATQVVDGAEIFVALSGLIDLDEERDRLQKDLEKIEKDLTTLNKQLSNENFVQRAPPEIVAEKQQLLGMATEKKGRLEDALNRLN